MTAGDQRGKGQHNEMESLRTCRLQLSSIPPTRAKATRRRPCLHTIRHAGSLHGNCHGDRQGRRRAEMEWYTHHSRERQLP